MNCLLLSVLLLRRITFIQKCTDSVLFWLNLVSSEGLVLFSWSAFILEIWFGLAPPFGRTWTLHACGSFPGNDFSGQQCVKRMSAAELMGGELESFLCQICCCDSTLNLIMWILPFLVILLLLCAALTQVILRAFYTWGCCLTSVIALANGNFHMWLCGLRQSAVGGSASACISDPETFTEGNPPDSGSQLVAFLNEEFQRMPGGFLHIWIYLT